MKFVSRFAGVLCVMLFSSLLVAAQTDDCANEPSPGACRQEAAGILQSELGKSRASMQVTSVGKTLIFADPESFRSQADRAAFHNDPKTAVLEKDLCRFGFKKIRIQATSKENSGEEYDLVCQDAGKPKGQDAGKPRDEAGIPLYLRRPSPEQQRPQPVSQYMRKVALIYLEQIDQLSDRCTDHDSCKEILGSMENGEWDKALNPLDDRITISLGDAPIPGDKLFWGLLKSVKDSGWFLLAGKMLWFGDIEGHREEEGDKEKTKEWAGIFANCYSEAHETALQGHTFPDDDCATKIQAQVKKEPK